MVILEKIKLLEIKLEKIKNIIYVFFIKFHKFGFFAHISKGWIPYVIIISFEEKIG